MGTLVNQPSLQFRPESRVEVMEPEESQIPGILGIWKEFIDLHAMLDPYYRRSEGCEQGMTDFIRRCLRDEDKLILVAKIRSEVLGYIIAEVVTRPPCFITSEYGSIIDLAVKEGHRRNGVGDALYSETLGWMQTKGVKRIELKVSVNNEGADVFWRKRGFREHLSMMYRDL
jgi:ribosomal protein S18 acetylase RimI-like enzyme